MFGRFHDLKEAMNLRHKYFAAPCAEPTSPFFASSE
jgi:hypothetical protein